MRSTWASSHVLSARSFTLTLSIINLVHTEVLFLLQVFGINSHNMAAHSAQTAPATNLLLILPASSIQVEACTTENLLSMSSGLTLLRPWSIG